LRGWNSAAAAPGDKATLAPHTARASGARAKCGRRANQSPVECIVKDVDIVFASIADAQNETPRELLDQADNEEGADTLQLGDNFKCAAASAAAESNGTLPPPVIATPAEPEQGEFSKLAAYEQSKPGEYARAATRPAPASVRFLRAPASAVRPRRRHQRAGAECVRHAIGARAGGALGARVEDGGARARATGALAAR